MHLLPWTSSHDNLANIVLSEVIFKPDFISESEETSLVTELDTHLLKHRYEIAHWDYAITHYRETERKQWRTANRPVIDRLKKFTTESLEFLPLIHVLDLCDEGEIKAHVDKKLYLFFSLTLVITVVLIDCDLLTIYVVMPLSSLLYLPIIRITINVC
ncbi:unnamed protein product [Echinostoma caproni]|uniref:Glycogen phosphorylase n=1 Tax=Echinostoma caproni TaxID=27848 RepID=A0A183A2D8_9TREM|nr:unnamed protein product [Echinostoma caproni]